MATDDSGPEPVPQPEPAKAMPADPVSPMLEAFLSLRQMHMDALAAGFSPWESLVLLGTFLSGTGAHGKGDQE